MQDVIRHTALRALREHRQARLVTICAATGSGKTTLLRQWMSELTREANDFKLLQLEQSADDRALALALLAEIDADKAPAKRLQSFYSDDAEELTRRLLLAARSSEKAQHVIIDDFHRVRSPATVRLLTRLLYLDAPAPVRFLITSRVSTGIPVSGLRLSGDLLELGSRHLKFSAEEAADMAEHSGLRLDGATWRAFAEKVDGWAVALRLALALLRDGTLNIAELLNFSGSQRDMATYLSEQILRGLSQDDRALLLKCAAFQTLRPDIMAASLGEELAARAVMLMTEAALPLDRISEHGQETRLHGVVRNFLISEARASGMDLTVLRRAAATHLETKGEWRKATSYALSAGDLEFAAAIAERGGGWRLIYRGEEGTAEQFRLLAALPRESYAAFPKTALGLAVAAAKRGEIEHALDVNAFMRRAVPSTDAAIHGEIRLLDALLDLYRDAPISPEAVARLENDLLDTAEIDDVRLALTQNLLCFNNLQSENFQGAIRYGRLSMATFQAASSAFGAAHLPLHIGQAEFFAGRMDNARATLEQHLLHCETVLGPDADLTQIARAFVGEVDLEQGVLPDDPAGLDRAFACLGSRDSWFDPLASLVLTRVRLARLNEEAPQLDQVLSAAEDVAFSRRYGRLSDFILRLRIDALTRERQVDDARSLLVLLGDGHSEDQNPPSLRGIPAMALLARLELTEGAPDKALHALDRLPEAIASQNNVQRFVRLRLLRLRALIALGDEAGAADLLIRMALILPVDQHAMTFVEEGPEIASFVARQVREADPAALVSRRLGKLQGKIQKFVTIATPILGRPSLTGAEQDVVRLLGTGRSNKEIARDLGCSVNTVKFHLSNLYRKLGVKSRTAAVTAARETRVV